MFSKLYDEDAGCFQRQKPARKPYSHEYDEDAVCIHCGFDGAEWSHWKNYTYEGKASSWVKTPLCNKH